MGKISEFTELTSVAAGDLIPIVDVSTGITKKVKASNIAFNIDTLTELTSPDASDKVPIFDVSVGENKYVLASNLTTASYTEAGTPVLSTGVISTTTDTKEVKLGTFDGNITVGMDLEKIKYRLYNQKFSLIAHRGFGTIYPENTLLGFSSAVENGCDAIEFDVQVSSDGVPVVFHDTSVDALTDGTGNVAQLTASYLAGLTISSAASTAFASIGIPTFDEVCKFAVKSGVKIVPEIKGYRTQADIDIIYAVLESYNLQKNCLVQSFTQSDLDYLRTLDPDIEVGLLTLTYSSTKVDQLSLMKSAWLLIDYTELLADPTRVEYCYSKGVNIGVWTVDFLQTAISLRRIGVNNIMSNLFLEF